MAPIHWKLKTSCYLEWFYPNKCMTVGKKDNANYQSLKYKQREIFQIEDMHNQTQKARV